MAALREKPMSCWAGLLLLLLAFAVLYQPWRLGERELFWNEGDYAVQAQEMDRSLPLAVAHGVALPNAFPFYPLLVSHLRAHCPISMELALRLVSVAAAAATALLVGGVAGRIRGATAGLAAAAMFLSTNLVVEKALDGYPTFLANFFLLAAQLVYFSFGMGRAAWNRAWLFAAVLLAGAFYAGGFWYLVYFIFPLIFLRRPLSVGRRWIRPGFALGCVILIGVILFWRLPYWISGNTLPMTLLAGRESWSDYLGQLLEFPWNFALRLLPWTFLAWAPFCVALFPVDTVPLYSQYLRTIVISTFFLLWFRPGTDPRDFALLIGPLSIMVGLNYEMTVRRYATQLARCLRCCEYFLYVAAAALILFLVLPEWLLESMFHLDRPVEFRYQPRFLIIAGAIVLALLIFAAWFRSRKRKLRPVWAVLLLTGCAAGLFFWTVMVPYRTQSTAKRELGAELRSALVHAGVNPDRQDLKVYKLDILDLYGECYYLGVPVHKIFSLDELPKDQKRVYLFSTEFPQYPERAWSNLLPPGKTYRSHRICLWEGVLLDDPQE